MKTTIERIKFANIHGFRVFGRTYEGTDIYIYVKQIANTPGGKLHKIVNTRGDAFILYENPDFMTISNFNDGLLAYSIQIKFKISLLDMLKGLIWSILK